MKKHIPRRSFLRSSALVAGLGLSGGTLYGNNVYTKKEVVGHNDFTYQVDKGWGIQNPSEYPVMHCHEMVMDAKGRLLLLTTEQKNNVLIYNKDGKVTESWTLNLPEAHGLTIAGEGEAQSLWITDCKVGRVINVTLDGRIIRELELPKGILPADKDYKPTETTVAPNGDIYVADGYGSNLILHYSSRGEFKDAFGGDEHFNCAHGVTVDERTAEPTLLITSRTNQEFQRWSLDGKHLATYSLPGLWICRPVIHGSYTYFAVIVTKDWWTYDGMIAVLDEHMQVVSLPGGSAPGPTQDFSEVQYDGKTFLNPHDVCVDEDENLYVPQWLSGRTYPVRLRRV